MTLALFEETQKKSILLLSKVYASLELDMSHSDIHQLILNHAKFYEFQGWFRPPFVRINGKTQNQFLQKGSLIQIHLQPISDQSFGSVGLSKNFQTEARTSNEYLDRI